MKKAFKYLFLACGLMAVGVFIFWMMGVLSFSGAFDKHVTRQETVTNFAAHETDIMYFADLFLSKRPSGHELSFSIDGNKGTVSIGMPFWGIDQRFPNHHFDFRVTSVDNQTAFLKELGWDVQTFGNIVAAFRKTNCESVMTNDSIVSLEFKTGTWNSFGYQVHALPMDDSTIRKYEADGIQVLNKRVTVGRATAL